jgi:hypothetical protein
MRTTSTCSLQLTNVRENCVFWGNMSTYIWVFYKIAINCVELKRKPATNTLHLTVLQYLWTRYVCLFPCTPEGYCIFATCNLLGVRVASTTTSFKLRAIVQKEFTSVNTSSYSVRTRLHVSATNYKPSSGLNTIIRSGVIYLPLFSSLVIWYDG